MNYYLCHWKDGGDDSYTVIKQGQCAVGEWLRECLHPGDLGCPEWVVEQLDALDDPTCHRESPIQIMWQGEDYMYSITEIIDLGSFARDILRLYERIRTAHKWLRVNRFKTHNTRLALGALENCLRALGMPVDG